MGETHRVKMSFSTKRVGFHFLCKTTGLPVEKERWGGTVILPIE